MQGLCSLDILANLMLAALARHSPGCLHFPHQSTVMTCLVSVSLDSQAWEPLRAGAKAATFCRVPWGSVQSWAREGAQTYW